VVIVVMIVAVGGVAVILVVAAAAVVIMVVGVVRGGPFTLTMSVDREEMETWLGLGNLARTSLGSKG